MAYTRMRFHIVTATRDREPLITPKVESILYPILLIQALRCDSRIIALGGIEDHVHWIIAIPPKHAVSDVVGTIKSGTSKSLRRRGIKELKDFEWQVGYGGFTLNPHDMRAVLNYVHNQKVHHRRRQVWKDYERTEE